MIPEYIRDDHALQQTRPYPCGYCSQYAGNALTDNDRAKTVISFGTYTDADGYEEDNRCLAYLNGPTSKGDCLRFRPILLDYRKPCNPDIFTYLESNYMMECISRIYENPGITVTEVLDRQRKGYNTRTQRIDELIQLSWVDAVDDTDCVHLYTTDRGDRIAKSIRELYDAILLDQQEGDILDDDDYAMIYQFIAEHRRCSTRWIYDQMNEGTRLVTSNNGDFDDTTPADATVSVILHTLHDRGYIKGEFDGSDWNTIRYDITERGKRAWERRQKGRGM